MSRKVHLYDAEHLTPVERSCESEMRQQSCIKCRRLLSKKGTGAKFCEADVDFCAVMMGKLHCVYYLEVAR